MWCGHSCLLLTHVFSFNLILRYLVNGAKLVFPSFVTFARLPFLKSPHQRTQPIFQHDAGRDLEETQVAENKFNRDPSDLPTSPQMHAKHGHGRSGGKASRDS